MYEQSELEKIYAEMLNGNLPENTPKTEAGTKVRLPDKWKTGTPNYIETTKGEIVIPSKQIATVEAVAVGNGETVPVPIGFYYVGGNLSSGVVISDNVADQNKFAGQAEVPSGLKVKEDGTIENELVGNQFVWIPCEYEGYTKTNWGQGSVVNRSNAYWSTVVDDVGKIQTKKYGGFYVGRYEAGLATTINEYDTVQVGASTIYNVEGIPQSKAGIVPWNFIDWTHAQVNAESMYNTGTVNSGLITGTQWDVMINKIASSDNTKSLTDSSSWGNYINTTLTYIGRSATNTSGKTSVFGTEETNETKNKDVVTILTTGASENTKAYNIYDVAGNVFEWTEEISLFGGNSTTQYIEIRAGGGNVKSSEYPACYRHGKININNTSYDIGYRVVLYMK